jgi:hypothetical protein
MTEGFLGAHSLAAATGSQAGRPALLMFMCGACKQIGQSEARERGPDGAGARQVLLISATLPREILEMTSKFMTDPIRVLVKRDEITLEGIKQVAHPRTPPTILRGQEPTHPPPHPTVCLRLVTWALALRW